MMSAIDAAETPVPVVRQLTRPNWVSRPTGDDMARAYPREAQRVGAGGTGYLDCRVSETGELVACSVIDKNPAFLHIGEGVLRLQKLFRMQPIDAEGQPVAGARVRIPVRYTLPGGTQWNDKYAIASACYGQTANLAEQNPGAQDAWQAAVYWNLKLSALVGAALGRPSEAEDLLRQARVAAGEGTLLIPKGADLATCMAAKA
jgi:TonB family protein